jgi:hypothetical protein
MALCVAFAATTNFSEMRYHAANGFCIVYDLSNIHPLKVAAWLDSKHERARCKLARGRHNLHSEKYCSQVLEEAVCTACENKSYG